MYLIFDTETTGLPRSWTAPKHDVANWPRLVQIAWAAHDAAGRETQRKSFLVRPEGFAIAADATRVHGISTERAQREGLALPVVLASFAEALAAARVVVAHNLDFDEAVVGAECVRAALPDPFGGKQRVCTMKASTELCALPGAKGFKWPRLPELHARLFGTPARELHEAAHDAAVCARCFFELQRLGIIRLARERTLFD